MSLLDTLHSVCRELDRLQVPYAVGGSLASSIWGQERATQDADVAAILSITQIETLEKVFEWPLIFQADGLKEDLESGSLFPCGQILNGETLDRVDLFAVQDLAYAHQQLERSKRVEVLPGVFIPFCSPEDTVIAKLRWYELGNRVSDKQWNDIVQVLEVQRGELDEEYLDRWASHFGISDLLQEARSEVLA